MRRLRDLDLTFSDTAETAMAVLLGCVVLATLAAGLV
jgi:hypothetical protein